MDEVTHEFDHLDVNDDPRWPDKGWHEHDHNHPAPFEHRSTPDDHRHYHTRVGKPYDHHPVDPVGDVRPATVADHDSALD